MTNIPASSAMSTTSSNSSSSSSKKNRRFSLIRLFNNSKSMHRNSTPSYRHSMDPSSMNSMETDMLRERRKSIAVISESTFRPMSFDLRSSSIRPILSKKETPQTEMTDKMRQFDELLQTRCSSTIRISLTPSLLQEPY